MPLYPTAATICGAIYTISSINQGFSGFDTKNPMRVASSASYTTGNIAMLASSFIKVISPTANINAFFGLAATTGAAFGMFASNSDATQENKHTRIFELIRSIQGILASYAFYVSSLKHLNRFNATYSSAISSGFNYAASKMTFFKFFLNKADSPLKAFTSLIFMINSGFMIADGTKEDDKHMFQSGILNFLAGATLLFIKKH